MTGDKDKFTTLKKYDGGSIKFVGEEVALIYRIGSIFVDGKYKINGVYYMQGLRHSLLSVSQIWNRGYEVVFIEIGCMIRKGKIGKLVAEGIKKSGNVYCIKERGGNMYVS